jgi:16S rRNA (cytosine1402-N4)-methyltransferase
MSVLELVPTTMKEINHYPVMYREIMELLDIAHKRVVVDGTLGMASHATKFLEAMDENALLVGIDKDEESLAKASLQLTTFGRRAVTTKGDFAHLDSILHTLGIEKADAILFDLGISTYQLLTAERGFSFLKEGPLDMRMDKDSFVCAADLVNNLSEMELENIFRKFGEERYAFRIARAIADERRKEQIHTTTQLTQLILKATPAKNRKYKIHPATRVFQALRIAVNRELEGLRMGIEKAIGLLDTVGRVAVISFHSLEDRIVKHTFKEFAYKGILKIITKKPIMAGEEELARNIASRSAKLRVAEKN